MTRLPSVGGDDGNWGTILNDFLSVEHDADGTLKQAADIADAKTKANQAVRNINGASPVNGSITLTATSVNAAPATHTHPVSDITNLQTSLDDKVTATELSAATKSYGLPSYGSTVKTWDSSISAYNLRPDNTMRWRAGLARAGRTDYNTTAGVLHELWLGDSIMGGCTGLNQTADSYGDTTRFDRTHAIPNFYGIALSSAYSVPLSGTGLVRACDATHIDSRWLYGSGATMNNTCLQLAGSGGNATFVSNVAGDVIRVTYYCNFSTGAPRLTVSLDGASSGAGYLEITGPSTSTYKVAELKGVTVTVGSQIKLTSPSTSAIQIAYIEVARTAGGISIHNLATSGTRATSTSWTNTSSGFSLRRQLTDPDVLTAYPWDVVHMGWGLFDATPTISGDYSQPPNATPAQVKQALIDIAATFPNADIVLHGFSVPAQLYVGAPGRWETYLTAYYQAADQLDCPLIDQNHATNGGYPSFLALGLTADTSAHLLPAAYALIGRAIAKVIT